MEKYSNLPKKKKKSILFFGWNLNRIFFYISRDRNGNVKDIFGIILEYGMFQKNVGHNRHFDNFPRFCPGKISTNKNSKKIIQVGVSRVRSNFYNEKNSNLKAMNFLRSNGKCYYQ